MSTRRTRAAAMRKTSTKKIKIEEDDVIIYTKPLTRSLRYQCCVRISTSLWGHFDLERAKYEMVKESLKTLNLSPVITDIINNHLKNVGQKLRLWVIFLAEQLQKSEDEMKPIYQIVGANNDSVVWASDGQINCRETLMNLASRNVFDDDEKELLVGAFLGDDHDAMYQAIFTGITDAHTLHIDPLRNSMQMPALIFRMQLKMDLDTILRSEPVNIKHLMKELTDVQNIQIVDYIWSHLNEAKQVEFASHMIRRYKMKFQCNLLSRMNAKQQRQIFTRIGIKIIENFAEESNDYAIITWIRIKDRLSGYYLFRLFKNLIIAMAVGYVDDQSCLMTDIWKSASPSLKNNFLNYQAKHGMRHVFYNYVLVNSPKYNRCTNIGKNVEFLVLLLSDLDSESRKEVILTGAAHYYCNWLFKEGRSNLVDLLVNLCLKDENDKVKFKERALNPATFEKNAFRYDWLKSDATDDEDF